MSCRGARWKKDVEILNLCNAIFNPNPTNIYGEGKGTNQFFLIAYVIPSFVMVTRLFYGQFLDPQRATFLRSFLESLPAQNLD
jgi:hypothetical protein